MEKGNNLWWELFSETGETSAYLIYKQEEKEKKKGKKNKNLSENNDDGEAYFI